MTALRIAGGTVVTMDAARRVLAGDVVVEDGRITAIGPDAPSPSGAQVIDAGGCLVIPGLVQAHVHTVQTLARGHADDLELLPWLRERIWPYEAALGPEDVDAAAELACAELLAGGTTAILDMGTVRHTDVVFEAARRAGLRATIGKCMMDAGDGVPAGLREETRASLDESEALARRWHGADGGRLRYGYAPRFVLSCTEDLLREVTHSARRMGCVIHTHASENPTECAVVRRERGGDNIDYLASLGMAGPDVVLAHCVWPTEAEKETLRRTQSSVAHCPSSNLKLASGVAPVVEYLARGVRVALGADGAPCNNDLDGFLELRLAGLLHKPGSGPTALPARQAFELATLAGARALGLEAEVGSLEVGKRGDVVVIDVDRLHVVPTADPYSMLVYAARASDVRDVVVDGRVVVRAQELLTLDKGATIARARAARRRLDARL